MVAVPSLLWLAAIILTVALRGSEAARRFGRRSDLDLVPPINSSAAAHWTVPVQGSKTCDAGQSCGLSPANLE